MAQKTSSPGTGSGEQRKVSQPGKPAPSEVPSSAPPEPAQGHTQTKARYRDRPTDDGKYGDGDQEPTSRD
jgi:hypothetical protein